MKKIKVLAISGSTRAKSSNLNLIKAIAKICSEKFEISILEDLTVIPHFNPDLDNELGPAAVEQFRKSLRQSDAILICTPEYAVGVPGTLKNAIDWTVSSMEFSNKPVALITGSTSGQKAHQSLLGTLLILEAKIVADTQLVVSAIKTKVNDECEIIDEATFQKIDLLINQLEKIVKRPTDKTIQFLSAPEVNKPY